MSTYWTDAFNRYNAAAVETGRFAAKTLVSINGGATIAILTFAGNLPKDKAAALPGLAHAIQFFGWGVAFGTAVVCLAYLGELMNTRHAAAYVKDPNGDHESIATISVTLQIAAIVCGALALGLFGGGVCKATAALTMLGAT